MSKYSTRQPIRSIHYMKIIGALVLLVLLLPTEEFGIIGRLFVGTVQVVAKELERFTMSLGSFMVTYRKSYSSLDQLTYRTTIFKNNLNTIDLHNKNSSRLYSLGVTQFADMTLQEFQQSLLMPKFKFIETVVIQNRLLRAQNTRVSVYSPLNSFVTVSNPIKQLTPTQSYVVDWRKDNISGVVKQQGICGSCYAFAALGAVESMYKINSMSSLGITGKLLGSTLDATLSEQHVIDCCNIPGRCDMGCNGGYIWDVLDFVKNHGVSIEASSPYNQQMSGGYKRKCGAMNGQFKNILDPIRPYTNVTRKNVTDLKQKLMKGPVAVLIDATNMPFYMKSDSSKGVPFSNCSQTVNNHAVLLVGIDKNQNWIVKNSWGSEWGENGYITLAPGNTCGIANYAVLPNPYK